MDFVTGALLLGTGFALGIAFDQLVLRPLVGLEAHVLRRRGR